MEEMTLVLFMDTDPTSDGDRVWLADKKLKVGAGQPNGYGGGVKSGESPKAAAVREVWEECGVRVLLQDLKQVALLHIHRNGHGHEYDCHVFMVRRWMGSFKETKEMSLPKPYLIGDVPCQRMMAADKFWLPPVLSGLTIESKFRYSEDRKEVPYFDCHTTLFI